MERRVDGSYEERRSIRSLRVATGTLACPQCDAPVVLGAPVEPADWIGCPYCLHTGATDSPGPGRRPRPVAGLRTTS